MKRTIEAMKTGNTPAGNDMTMAWVHVAFSFDQRSFLL